MTHIDIEGYSIYESKPKTESAPFLNEEHLKNAAKRLKPILMESGLTLGHAKCLQVLSQSLYAKPFEEIQKTILNLTESTKESVANGKSQIFKLNDIDYLFFFNGELIDGTYPSLDNEKSFNELINRVKQFSKQYEFIDLTEKTDFNYSDLLQDYLVSPDFNYDDLYILLNMSGLIQSKNFDFINKLNKADVFKIDDNFAFINLSDDYPLAVFENDFYDGTACVWMPEHNGMEWFFSLEQLLQANYVEDNEWTVPCMNNDGTLSNLDFHLIKLYQ
jgi:hypothetical protein